MNSPYMVLASSRCRELGIVIAEGAATAAVDGTTVEDAAGLDALALGLGGHGCGFCAVGLAFVVCAAIASAAVGVLPSDAALVVCVASCCSADIAGLLRGVGPLGV